MIQMKKRELIIVVMILAIAAFMRFYRISEYMTFLGDEGRDALMVKRILTTFDLPLLGPPTSIGNIYLGPLYYYMMSVPMAIFWLNPVAAAGMVAAIGVVSVALIYYLARKWFTIESAIVASCLYAISPVTIIYSRSSWNPNPTPFFTLVAFFGLYKARKSNNFKWFILTGIALAFAVQMHYLALILLPIFGLLWFYEFYLQKFKFDKNFIFGTVGSVVMFLFLMSPLLIFDLKHNFMNFDNLKTFFSDRQTTINLNIFNTLDRVIPIYRDNLVSRYITGKNTIVGGLQSILILIPVVANFYLGYKRQKHNWALTALTVWLVGGILGLALYKQTIYDHYLGFLNPAPYLLLGAFVYLFKNKIRLILASLFLLILGIMNLQQNPLLTPPQNQLARTQKIAQFVITEINNTPFNFALIAKNNYDAAYQFYLEIFGQKPKKLPFDITAQLFVVCEDPECFPINHPKYEIAAFGWAKIETEKTVAGVKVYKLISNPNGKPSLEYE